MKPSFKNYLTLFLKCFATGMMMCIPGVSGGTLAIAFGFYDRLLGCAADVFRLKKEQAIFLILAGTAAGAGLFAASIILTPMLDSYGGYMRLFFCGAIAGAGVVYLLSNAPKKLKTTHIISLLAGIAIPFMMALIPEDTLQVSGFFGLLITGIPLSAAFILPGISTSHFLLLCGLYEQTLEALSRFDIAFLLPLSLGCAAGTFALAKLVGSVSRRYPVCFAFAISGFIFAGLPQIYPEEPFSADTLLMFLLPLVGFLAVVLVRFSLKKYERRK